MSRSTWEELVAEMTKLGWSIEAYEAERSRQFYEALNHQLYEALSDEQGNPVPVSTLIHDDGPEPETTEAEELASQCMANPEALWLVLTSEAKAAGPWVDAESKSRRTRTIGGFWRLSARSGRSTRGLVEDEDVAKIHPWWPGCNGIQKSMPTSWEYDDREEDEEYIHDLAEWQDDSSRRKPWVWRLSSWGFEHRTEYAETKEEAMALADAALRAEGWLLIDRVGP